MSLIHRRDQVGRDVVALECHSCRVRYAGAELDELLALAFDDELRCLDPDCGAGGMIARRRSKMDERFPTELAARYTPIPDALGDHAGALGLRADEFVLIITLERYRRLMGDEVFPGRAALAARSGLSVDQVKRATRKLVEKGLITRRQVGANGRRGRGSNHISLDPLWNRLAALERGESPSDLRGASAPQTEAQVAVQEAPANATGEDLRADDPLFAGAEEAICGAPARHEVDVEEVDVEEDPCGTSPAAPDLAEGGNDHLHPFNGNGHVNGNGAIEKTVIGLDLGPCGALLATGRCEGRLLVERDDGRILEAVCSECGDVAALPVAELAERARQKVAV